MDTDTPSPSATPPTRRVRPSRAKRPPARQVTVEAIELPSPDQHQSSAARYNDVHVDTPVVIAAIRNGITMGWNNETICRVVGMPPEVVDKQRTLVKKK